MGWDGGWGPVIAGMAPNGMNIRIMKQGLDLHTGAFLECVLHQAGHWAAVAVDFAISICHMCNSREVTLLG
jgi:hypothetical protein